MQNTYNQNPAVKDKYKRQKTNSNPPVYDAKIFNVLKHDYPRLLFWENGDHRTPGNNKANCYLKLRGNICGRKFKLNTIETYMLLYSEFKRQIIYNAAQVNHDILLLSQSQWVKLLKAQKTWGDWLVKRLLRMYKAKSMQALNPGKRPNVPALQIRIADKLEACLDDIKQTVDPTIADDPGALLYAFQYTLKKFIRKR